VLYKSDDALFLGQSDAMRVAARSRLAILSATGTARKRVIPAISTDDSWKLDPALGGPDAFHDVGTHVVDLLLHLLPLPTRVAAVAGRSRFKGTLDNVSALVTCGDVVVELNASQSTAFAGNRLVLDFEDGSVTIGAAFGEAAFLKMQVVSHAGASVMAFPSVNPHQEEVRAFAGLLRGETSPATTVDEACRGPEVLEAIVRSYTDGVQVEVKSG
jgi:predicted dehydrogenase